MNYIYESPDGGQTVYARKPGETTRVLVNVNNLPINNFNKEIELWFKIKRAAESNNAIQTALDRVIILYKLSLEYEDV